MCVDILLLVTINYMKIAVMIKGEDVDIEMSEAYSLWKWLGTVFEEDKSKKELLHSSMPYLQDYRPKGDDDF